MCSYYLACKEWAAERFLTALVESLIILSKSILITLKATERKETKRKSKFSSPTFKASTIMVLTSKKLHGEGFSPDILLKSPTSEIKRLIT